MKHNLVDSVYLQLQERIVRGQLLPGSRMSDRALADNLGVSRTPVREALRTLQSQGFLEEVPDVGLCVRTLKPEQILSLQNTRRLLEPEAAAFAAERITEPALERLRELCRRQRNLVRRMIDDGIEPWDEPVAVDLATSDVEFHLVIVNASEDYFLRKFVTQLGAMTGLVLFASPPTFDWKRNVATTHLEHMRILRAIERRSPQQARQAMQRHLDHMCEKSKAMMAWEIQSGRRREVRGAAFWKATQRASEINS